MLLIAAAKEAYEMYRALVRKPQWVKEKGKLVRIAGVEKFGKPRKDKTAAVVMVRE